MNLCHATEGPCLGAVSIPAESKLLFNLHKASVYTEQVNSWLAVQPSNSRRAARVRDLLAILALTPGNSMLRGSLQAAQSLSQDVSSPRPHCSLQNAARYAATPRQDSTEAFRERRRHYKPRQRIEEMQGRSIQKIQACQSLHSNSSHRCQDMPRWSDETVGGACNTPPAIADRIQDNDMLCPTIAPKRASREAHLQTTLLSPIESYRASDSFGSGDGVGKGARGWPLPRELACCGATGFPAPTQGPNEADQGSELESSSSSRRSELASSTACSSTLSGSSSSSTASLIRVTLGSLPQVSYGDLATTYRMAHGLMRIFPKLYRHAVRSGRAVPAADTVFRSVWGESLKAAAMPAVLATTNSAFQSRASTPASNSVGNLREWLTRSRLYVGDILSDAAASAVSAALSEADDADLDKLMAGLRTLYTILDPGRMKSAAHRDYPLLTPYVPYHSAMCEAEVNRMASRSCSRATSATTSSTSGRPRPCSAPGASLQKETDTAVASSCEARKAARGECEVGGPVNEGALKDLAALPSSNALSNGGFEVEDQGFIPAGAQDYAASPGSCIGSRDQAETALSKEKSAGGVRPGTAPPVGPQAVPDVSGSSVGPKSPPSAHQQVRGTHDSTPVSNASLPKASAECGRDVHMAKDVELNPQRVPPAENGISSEPTSTAAGTQGSRGDHEMSTAAGIQGADNACLAKLMAPIAASSPVHVDDGVIAPWEWARAKGAACVSAYTDDFSGGALLLKATHEAAKRQSQGVLAQPVITAPFGQLDPHLDVARCITLFPVSRCLLRRKPRPCCQPQSLRSGGRPATSGQAFSRSAAADDFFKAAASRAVDGSRSAWASTSVPLGKNGMNMPMEKQTVYRCDFKPYTYDLARQRAMVDATRAVLQAPTAPVGRLAHRGSGH
eukprot:jgi/Botrbrau1/14389/Bobra.0014s0038.1